MTKNNPVVVDLDDFAALAATVGKVDPPAGPACIGERPGQASDGRFWMIHMKSWPKPGGIVDERAATGAECQAMIEATRARLKRNPEYQWDGADPRAIGGSYLFQGWMGNPVDQFLVYSPEAIRTNRRSLALFESTSRDFARAVAAASPALGRKRSITVPAKPQTTPMDRYWSLYNDALELPALAATEVGPRYLEQAQLRGQRLANAAPKRAEYFPLHDATLAFISAWLDLQAWLGEMAIGAYKDAAEPDSGMLDVVASIFGNPTANPESPTQAEMAEALDRLGVEIDRLVREAREESEPHAIDPDLLAGLRPMNGFARGFGMIFQPDPA